MQRREGIGVLNAVRELPGDTSSSQKHSCFLQVNFDKVPMEMRLPVRCPIKRDFLAGIQVEFKQSPHQRSLRAQLYWLQVTLPLSAK